MLYFGYLIISTVTFQTGQTLIKGPLQDLSDQGLHCLKINQCTINMFKVVKELNKGNSSTGKLELEIRRLKLHYQILVSLITNSLMAQWT